MRKLPKTQHVRVVCVPVPFPVVPRRVIVTIATSVTKSHPQARSRRGGAAEGKRVWLVNLYFGAGTAPTGALAESAARGLLARGWDVEVLASRAGYNARLPDDDQTFAGHVHWRYSIFRDARGVLGRLLCWGNFYLAVAWWIFTRPLPDKVILLTTPPFLHVLFIVRRWLTRPRVELILWNQDTYPEVLAAVGLARRHAVLYRLLQKIENWGVSRLDRVIVLDDGMRKRLAEHGAHHIAVAPNWDIASPAADPPPAHPLLERIQQAKERYRFIVIHTGNYGWGHDLGPALRFVQEHPEQRLFFFVFLGGGEKWPHLTQWYAATQPDSVAIASYVPAAVLNQALRAAHFGLAALEEPCVGLMSPSKIHGYLACGKPLIYLGPPGSNVAEAITAYDCGFIVPPTAAGAWERLVEQVAAADFPYEQYARQAVRAFEERYQEDVGVERFCAAIAEPRLRLALA
jgi:glycosyltransferase involved in cell wall biosynthesis